MARGDQDPDDVHPLEDLAGAQESAIVCHIGRDPLV
jgi:hypothetical protein